MPCALRCVVFGVTSLKLMREEKEVGGKNRKKKAWHCFFSFTSPPVPGVVPSWQDLEIADELWIEMT